MAWSRVSSPPGGSGMYPVMSFSEQTTSFRRDSTSGRARLAGTGVTSPTHSDDSRGVSMGTFTMTRGVSPATSAYRRIIST